jgi:putative phage-type endonuclease
MTDDQEIDLANPPALPPGDDPWAVVFDPAVDGDPRLDPKAREEWLRRRRHYLGASEVAAVLGLNPWRSALEVYDRKVNLTQPKRNRAMNWGHIVEPFVGRDVAAQVGRTYREDGRLLVSRAHPWLSMTLDGWLDRTEDLEEVPEFQELPDEVQTEIKSTRYRGEWREKIPPMVDAQVQQQLLIGVGQHSAIGVFFFDERKTDWDLVELKEKFLTEILLPITEEFWHRVINRDPPPVQGIAPASVRATLAMMFPLAVEGRVVELGTEFAEMELERAALKAKMKACKDRIDVLESKLVGACGDAEKMYFPVTGVTLPYQNITRRGYTVASQKFRQFGTRKESE